MRVVVRRTVSLFIQGLLALLPLLVTVYLCLLLIRFGRRLIDDAVLLLPPEAREVPLLVVLTEIAVVAALFLLITALGALARTVAGRTMVRGLDRFFTAIPGLAPVYRATRQVVDVLGGGQQRFFTRPVLVEYPSTGVWAVAFHTGDAPTAIRPGGDGPFVTVFIPSTPNPTTGWLAVVQVSRIRPLDLSVEDAMKIILTGGVVKS